MIDELIRGALSFRAPHRLQSAGALGRAGMDWDGRVEGPRPGAAAPGAARVSPGGRRTNELAKHTSEIRYVFGNLAPADDYDTVDVAISQAMQGAWIAFARLGVPCNPDGSPWPRYERTAPFLTWIENEMTSHPFVIDELTAMIHSLRTEDDLDGSH